MTTKGGLCHGWLRITRHVDHFCGGAMDGLCLLGLELELEFQQLNFVLLLDQCQFSCRWCMGSGCWSRLLLPLLLGVEDQPGDEISAKADQLRLGVVAAVA